MSNPKHVIILGGGVGALISAYYLTSKPNWQDEYDVTIYQLGWRLGGKGASSRDLTKGCRIEEHGLHLWFGFYQNSFATMRSCYAELNRPEDSPIPNMEKAFHRHDDAFLLQQLGADDWSKWHIPFPDMPGMPGDPNNRDHSEWDILKRLFKFIIGEVDRWLLSVHHTDSLRPATPARLRTSIPEHDKAPTGLHLALSFMDLLDPDPKKHDGQDHEQILDWLDSFRTTARGLMGPEVKADSELKRLWLAIDLCAAIGKGILADGLIFKGLGSIDDEEFRAWLIRHGAEHDTAWSTPVRALYDCCFAYEDGDIQKPNFAAGVALGCALRIGLMYFGHVFYEMQAGMGDVVVAPLYEVLKKRGVQFEFFQRAKKLHLSEDKKRIGSITFGRQVTLKVDTYDPLILLDNGLPVWPKHPRYEQIQEGEELKAGSINLESYWTPWKERESEWVLDIGESDEVVLGISLGGLFSICEELCAESDDWRNLVDQLPSMQTQSTQLWLTKDIQELGWPDSIVPAMVAAPEPLDVWADMSHLIPQECWGADDPPQCILYFCGPLKGDMLNKPHNVDIPKEAMKQVRNEAVHWCTNYTGWILDNAVQPPGSKALDWDLLYGAGNLQGEERIDSQWLRANIDPTERYVLSPARCNRYRLPSDQSGFSNLVLAGDWTRTAINAGCVEAAVMSGMAASRKICGYPKKIFDEQFLID